MKIKEVILDELKKHPKKAYAVEELAMELDLTRASDFKLFVKTLAALEGEGLLNLQKWKSNTCRSKSRACQDLSC